MRALVAAGLVAAGLVIAVVLVRWIRTPDPLTPDLASHIDGTTCAHGHHPLRCDACAKLRADEDQAIAFTRPAPDPHRDDLGCTAAERRREVEALNAIPTRDHTAQEG